MNSHFKFLRRVRIHGEECGAVARALHHEVKNFSSPAVFENVSRTTYERKQMPNKTFFKRFSLGIVLSLGLGLLGVPTSQAAVNQLTVAVGSATATAAVAETATGTMTHTFTHTLDAVESATVRYTCAAPTGATCPAIEARQLASADTANVILRDNAGLGWSDLSTANQGATISGWTDSSTASSTGAVRSTWSFKAVAFSAAGTYTYTFYSISGINGLGSSVVSSSVTWTVTVTAPDLAGASLAALNISSDELTASNYRNLLAPSSDSAIVASAGLATATAAASIRGYAFIRLKNAAGDTRVAVGSGFRTVDDTITVTVSGPGFVSNDGSTRGKSATLNARNTGGTTVATETLTIHADGTPGTMTLTFARGTVSMATRTVTFTGTAASAVVYLSDTITALGGAGVNLAGHAKDSGGNVVRGATLYVFSSDTAVAGSIPTSTGATTYRTTHACTSSATTGVFSCAITLTDTGTATITLRDSWTVSASTWSSNEVVLDVRGNTIRALTAAFDKATYAPGEKAIITLTATDAAAKALATRSGDTGRLTQVVSTPVLSQTTVTGQAGTQGLSYTDTTFLGYLDTGVETRVVFMPTYAVDVTYSVVIPGFGVGAGNVTVSATAKVVDPNQVATNAAIAATQAAADAATDAAAEAIDAANAATDAANLAAEAADAATVAAEEARDAADAATAAVEELATQVATLMAALKAQITTLANTVAKIAKKVKA